MKKLKINKINLDNLRENNLYKKIIYLSKKIDFKIL